MAENKIERLIERAEASKNDSSVTSAKVVFAEEEAATGAFERYCDGLTDIEAWRRSSTPSSYTLFTPSGEEAGRTLEEGRFIRIAIAASGKFDWVRVVSIRRSDNEMVVTVTPTFDPTERPQRPDVISHFFAPEATNNFCLQRSGQYVTMWVIGLNEHQNTGHAAGIVDTVRNVAAANFGSYLGLQKTVWTEFCTNFLNGESGAETA
jgi:hypothetical protein